MQFDKKRGTGRTTRMLRHALALEKAGEKVYIIAANYGHASGLFVKLCEMNQSLPRRMSALEIGKIKIEAMSSVLPFDWETMRIRGAPHDAVTLMDHYVIESRFHLMLKELEAYDV